MCLVSYVLGFIFITEAGFYYVSVVDGLSAGFTLFAVAALETIAIAFVSDQPSDQSHLDAIHSVSNTPIDSKSHSLTTHSLGGGGEMRRWG